ncbi:MAG: sigma-54-dependent Fis family transcriptional regulator, partial [Candidatus Eisenbacteria bacterium]|nr:sigma-54-dependent Fis family transcriptional regulator [Candidatus Eisenbacteria bacterium]
MKPRVLIVDDEKNIRRTLELTLRGAGYEPVSLDSGRALLERVEEEPADLVLLDVRLGHEDGMTLLRELGQKHPGLPVIMISGHATVALAVEATQAGAIDFLEKPLDRERVLLSLRNTLRMRRLHERVDRLETREERRRILVGDGPSMQALRRTIAKVATTNATVLITGESGTGKELVARAIHAASGRRDGPFVKVNCAAIPDDLIEAELFGSVRGAFTGADRTRDGRFLLADGGTILLDEIGDMSMRVQAKVLRVLQEGELERVGDSRTVVADVRVLAATHRALAREVTRGNFREDLFFRLSVLPIIVPPLRE